MSRCKYCNLSFDEENSWQEYCCLDHAQLYICDHILNKQDEIANSRPWRDWNKWVSNPYHRKTIRFGKKATIPTFGVFVDRKVNVSRTKTKKEIQTIKVNVGGDVVIRPITDHEKAYIINHRGRDGFSDCTVRRKKRDDLPSQGGATTPIGCSIDAFERW